MSLPPQSHPLKTEKPTMPQIDHHVTMPDMFVSFLSQKPHINPHYEKVKRESEAWIAEYVVSIVSTRRCKVKEKGTDFAIILKRITRNISGRTFPTSYRFLPERLNPKNYEPFVTG